MGLVERGQAYGGALPTEAGTRVLVERWLDRPAERAPRARVLGQIDRFLAEVVDRLAAETGLPAFFILPDLAGLRVAGFAIHRLGPLDGLLGLTLESGWVETRRFDAPPDVDLEAIGAEVEKVLAGAHLSARLHDRLAGLGAPDEVLEPVHGLLDETLDPGRRARVSGLDAGWRDKVGESPETALARHRSALCGRPTALFPEEHGMGGVVLLGHVFTWRRRRAVLGSAGPLAGDWPRAISALRLAAGARTS